MSEMIVDREFHYRNAAKRFAADAKMFRCHASIHVENKDDIVFWSTILKHFKPNMRFHFVSGSRNEYGNETSGVTQCLKYLPYLSKDFFLCIDSDYRFLMQEHEIGVHNFILQTYTYSFENHHCYAKGLSAVCERVTRHKNNVFDFENFLRRYSVTVYDLFIWHLHLSKINPTIFPKYDFNRFISIIVWKPNRDVNKQTSHQLEDLHSRVEKRVRYFKRRFPEINIEKSKNYFHTLGLNPSNCYLYIRGHNIYDMITLICKDVCKQILEDIIDKNEYSSQLIRELYQNKDNVDSQLKMNINYGEYSPINLLEEDIYAMFPNIPSQPL